MLPCDCEFRKIVENHNFECFLGQKHKSQLGEVLTRILTSGAWIYSITTSYKIYNLTLISHDNIVCALDSYYLNRLYCTVSCSQLNQQLYKCSHAAFFLQFRTVVNNVYVGGYSISVVALLLSIVIFIYFR